jgi:hypothetical protein
MGDDAAQAAAGAAADAPAPAGSDAAKLLMACPGPMRGALGRYFAAVNQPAGPDKLAGVLATFEAAGGEVVNNGGAPVAPRDFYGAAASPVLSVGFRAEPDYGTLVCSDDGRTAAISIRLVPGG